MLLLSFRCLWVDVCPFIFYKQAENFWSFWYSSMHKNANAYMLYLWSLFGNQSIFSFLFSSSEGDCASDFFHDNLRDRWYSYLLFLIPTTICIFLLAFKFCLLYVSCFVPVLENPQCSCRVASGIASRWMEGDLI